MDKAPGEVAKTAPPIPPGGESEMHGMRVIESADGNISSDTAAMLNGIGTHVEATPGTLRPDPLVQTANQFNQQLAESSGQSIPTATSPEDTAAVSSGIGTYIDTLQSPAKIKEDADKSIADINATNIEREKLGKPKIQSSILDEMGKISSMYGEKLTGGKAAQATSQIPGAATSETTSPKPKGLNQPFHFNTPSTDGTVASEEPVISTPKVVKIIPPKDKDEEPQIHIEGASFPPGSTSQSTEPDPQTLAAILRTTQTEYQNGPAESGEETSQLGQESVSATGLKATETPTEDGKTNAEVASPVEPGNAEPSPEISPSTEKEELTEKEQNVLRLGEIIEKYDLKCVIAGTGKQKLTVFPIGKMVPAKYTKLTKEMFLGFTDAGDIVQFSQLGPTLGNTIRKRATTPNEDLRNHKSDELGFNSSTKIVTISDGWTSVTASAESDPVRSIPSKEDIKEILEINIKAREEQIAKEGNQTEKQEKIHQYHGENRETLEEIYKKNP